MTTLHINPTTTLARIRACGPCADGWQKLLVGLGYPSGDYEPEREVSLGDIATTNDAADALWAVRALNWNDVAVRRAVIAGALLPAVTRAVDHTQDQRVHDCVAALRCWCNGDDTVDLRVVEAAAEAAWAAEAAEAAWAARAAAMAAEAAEAAAEWAARAAAMAAEAERARQRDDILAAFPLVALRRTP